jgi:accessory colonization factor AcfC
MKKYVLIFIAGLSSFVAFAQTDTLHVYGPGGPLSAMQECAKVFTGTTGIPVKVTGGPESKWIAEAGQNADLIYGGAEYMLTQFIQNHPGMVDAATRVELYKRAAAILVRPGNPKHIATLKDLTKQGVHILDVNGAGQLGLWEDIAGKENLIGGIQKNIAGSFVNTALAIDAWKKDGSYDAWITYASWHQNLKDITQVVELPLALRLYRGTPVALTLTSRHSQQGRQFVQFLQSAQGHAIFKKWGWE